MKKDIPAVQIPQDYINEGIEGLQLLSTNQAASEDVRSMAATELFALNKAQQIISRNSLKNCDILISFFKTHGESAAGYSAEILPDSYTVWTFVFPQECTKVKVFDRQFLLQDKGAFSFRTVIDMEGRPLYCGLSEEMAGWFNDNYTLDILVTMDKSMSMEKINAAFEDYHSTHKNGYPIE